MEDETPVIYGLEFQAKALTAQTGDTEKIRFLVGTQSLRVESQVHHIDFDDENNVINKNIYLHPDGEIWNISASTVDKELLCTCYNKTSEFKTEMKAAVWQLPHDFDSGQTEDHSAPSSVKLVCHLDNTDYGDMKSVLWHPTGDNSTVIGFADNHVILWDVNIPSNTSKKNSKETNQPRAETQREIQILTNTHDTKQKPNTKTESEYLEPNIHLCSLVSGQVIASTGLDSKGNSKFTSGRWNPHHNCTQVATANDTHIRGWDIRSMQQVYAIENAHGQLVRDLDFNPNKQYYLVSCGDDCKIKFWDTRKTTEALKVLSQHSHWVWSVKYNHFHDQLVLSSSSDSRVILNSIVSLSSEPYGNAAVDDDDDVDDSDEEEAENDDGHHHQLRSNEHQKDSMIVTYEEHEESVYAVDWSTADPWVFASLSYDGRLVINRVPRVEKYKILL